MVKTEPKWEIAQERETSWRIDGVGLTEQGLNPNGVCLATQVQPSLRSTWGSMSPLQQLWVDLGL